MKPENKQLEIELAREILEAMDQDCGTFDIEHFIGDKMYWLRGDYEIHSYNESDTGATVVTMAFAKVLKAEVTDADDNVNDAIELDLNFIESYISGMVG